MNITNLLTFTMATFSVLFILVFVLKIPHLITKSPGLVNEYYFKNFSKNIPFDFIFILLYYLTSLGLIKLFNVKKDITKVFFVAITTFLLTSAFSFYFRSKPMTKSFFSRWFYKVGYSASIYDIIILVFVYLANRYLQHIIHK